LGESAATASRPDALGEGRLFQEVDVKIISAIGLVALLVLSIGAQQRAQNPVPAPASTPQVLIVPAADLAAIIAKQPADRNGTATLMQLDPYRINMEHRVVDQAASVHEKEAELFYVLDGAGTLVTGGKLVDEKRTNDANLSGTSISGGVTKQIKKGDFVLVPEGVPHHFPKVEGNLTLMSLHLPRAK
jgi:mannose-6-phosphate isomerase-like protein (cupin superfamily)